MKAEHVICAVLALGSLSLATPSFAEDAPKRFSLLLSGGPGTTGGGDLSTVFAGENALIRDVASLGGLRVTDTFRTASWGPEFEVEFLFRPFRNFGLSLGTGWLAKWEDARGAAESGASTKFSIDWTTDYHLIPVKLSAVYFLPAGAKLTAYAKAGAGYYFGRMKYSVAVDENLTGPRTWELSDGTATDGGFGFHGGLGLEYAVSPAVSIFAEALGRSISLNGWAAEQTYSDQTSTISESGTFWYAERFQPLPPAIPESDPGKSYATFVFAKDRPDDADLRNVRKMVFGFSGFAVKAGFKIGF
jgi:hypothetical protein